MDSGASNHMTPNHGNLTSSTPSAAPNFAIVGNGSHIPITHTGTASLPFHQRCFYLNNILVTPNLIKGLISVCHFTTDNLVSVEFDPFGLSVKDLQTRREIIRCNSSGDLYPLCWPPPTPSAHVTTTHSLTLWHRRLGHLSRQALSHLASASHISCNKIE